MINRRQALVGLALCALPQSAVAADMGGDIAILRRAYTALHPGLYRYATPAQVEARLARLERVFAEGPPRRTAFLALSRFLASVRCGHTYANPYNHTRVVAQELFGGADRLPFHFRMLDGRMIVTRNNSGDEMLARGAEIRAIDGRAPRDIMRTLLPYTRADGGNDDKRRALLEVQGQERFETFDVFYPLLFPVRDGAFTLDVHQGDKRERTRVQAIDLAARAGSMVSREDGGPAWTLRHEGTVAIFDMPTWALYDNPWDWRSFLASSFEEMSRRGTQALIVDLRANEGGLDCGQEILARMIDAPLLLSGDERRVRYRTTPADLNPYLDTWDDSFRDWGDDAEPIGEGFFRLKGEGPVASIAPRGPRFRGRLIVLTSATNSSATFQFAQVVKSARLGQLVGGATGGNQRGINGGAFFFLRLPASGLEADLPLIGRFPLRPMPDAGLLPDVPVEDRPEDVAAGRDRVLEEALRIARA
jgi:hypothetical protein